MLDQKTKRKIDSARDILVGKVPDPKAQVEQITTALIYKFMDDMDRQAEELGGKPSFFTNGFEKYSWGKLMDPKLGSQARIDSYVEAITSMSQNPHLPQLFRDIFKDAFLPYRSPETLSMFLKEINGFSYDHSEYLGDAFEYLLSVMAAQGDAGQFRTPRHIIDFIVDVVNPQKDDTILDPACGTAGFLISAFKHIITDHDGKDNITGKPTNKEKPLTPDEKKKMMNNFVGYDISPDMVKLSRVNMYLHGFSEPKISEYDALSSEDKWDEMYDVIMANPPFMTPKGGIRPHKRFSVQANRSEVLFVDYILAHLNQKGRAGIIVPEGIIFQSANAYKKLRQLLIEDGLFAVVSLPAGVFNPYAGVKTSILFFDNELAKRAQDILFVKIENDGFSLGAQRREHDKNDLPKALKHIKTWQNALRDIKDRLKIIGKQEWDNAIWVDKEKIAESGDYNLSGDRYRITTDYAKSKWSVVRLGELEKQGKIEFLRGQGLSKKDIDKFGVNKCIHYGELYTLYEPIIENVISKTNFNGKILSVSGDVLVPSTTTADAMGIAIARALNENGVVLGGDINIIRTRNDIINSKFLSLLLNFPLKKELANYAKGVNILHISNKDIKQIKIPLPPLEVQEEIVAEIDGYQKIIDGAKQVVKNWKPSIKIDPEWEMVELGKIVNIYNGSTPKRTESSYWKNGNIPWFTVEDIRKQGRVIKNTKQKITEEGLKNTSVKLLPKNTVLLCCTASVGEYAITKIELTTNQQFNGLVVKNEYKEKLDPKFLFQISKTFKQELIRLSGKTSFNFVSVGSLKQIQIFLPPIKIQKQIVAEIEAEQKLVDQNKKLIEIFKGKIKEKIGEVWGK